MYLTLRLFRAVFGGRAVIGVTGNPVVDYVVSVDVDGPGTDIADHQSQDSSDPRDLIAHDDV